jgi:AraC-like DNA-binding protein
MGDSSVRIDVTNRNDAGAAVLARSSTQVSVAPPDALSDVLRLVQLTSAVFLQAEMTAPWAVRAPSSRVLARQLMPGAEHLIEYHLVLEGRCWIRLESGQALELAAGDLVIVPHGDPHVMSSDPAPAIRPMPAATMELPSFGDVVTYRRGGGGAATRLACGYLALDPRLTRPLLAALPPLLRVDAAGGDLRDWLDTYMRFRARGCGHHRPGQTSVLSKLSELMFAEALRRYVESMPPGRTGWLAALGDPHVGRALALVHHRPERPWTVAELGRAAGLSRSALAERFTALIGQPPMRYLTQWRLTLAAHLQKSSDRPAASIAGAVGYDSEAAFNRAFKREFGAPPATWRDRTDAADATDAPRRRARRQPAQPRQAFA